jgi:hypothetical protein
LFGNYWTRGLIYLYVRISLSAIYSSMTSRCWWPCTSSKSTGMFFALHIKILIRKMALVTCDISMFYVSRESSPNIIL